MREESGHRGVVRRSVQYDTGESPPKEVSGIVARKIPKPPYTAAIILTKRSASTPPPRSASTLLSAGLACERSVGRDGAAECDGVTFNAHDDVNERASASTTERIL